MSYKPNFIKTLESTNKWDIIEWHLFLQYKEFLTNKEREFYTDFILEKLLQHFDKEDSYKISNSEILFKYLTLNNILDSLERSK